MENDPFEEIFALNLGDFITEHLLSDELTKKIKKKIKAEPHSIRSQLKELVSIYSIENTLDILGFQNQEEYLLYNAVAKTIVDMLEVEACHIFLSKEQVKGNISKELFLAGSSADICKKGYRYDIGYALSEDNSIVNSFKNKEMISFGADENNYNYVSPIGDMSKAVGIDVFPICNSQICVGAIVLEKKTKEVISDDYKALLKSISTLFTTSLQVQTLIEEATILVNDESVKLSILKHLRAELTVILGDLGDAQQTFVERLADAVDEKSSNKNKHSKNTALIAQRIAQELGLNEKTKDLIYYAALLQNIGKIVLPQEIFVKKERLTKEEFNKLNNSPNIGVSILMKINFLSEIIPYIHYLKERWDGTGTPEGLSGLGIPFGSRIIAVADAYCALRESRSFRNKLSDEEALNIISEEAGTKWDPIVVETLKQIERI